MFSDWVYIVGHCFGWHAHFLINRFVPNFDGESYNLSTHFPTQMMVYVFEKQISKTFVNIPHPKVLAWYLFSKHLSQKSTEKTNNGKFPVSKPAAPPVLKHTSNRIHGTGILKNTDINIYHTNQPLHVGQHIMVPWMVRVIFGVCI